MSLPFLCLLFFCPTCRLTVFLPANSYVKHTTVGSGIVNFISGTSSGGVPSPTYNGTSDPLNGTSVVLCTFLPRSPLVLASCLRLSHELFLCSSAQASQFTSADGVLTVAWAVDEASGTIAFTLTLAGSGWMSVGWSASGVDRMANSDCVVAWIDASGVAHAIDTWYVLRYVRPSVWLSLALVVTGLCALCFLPLQVAGSVAAASGLFSRRNG